MGNMGIGSGIGSGIGTGSGIGSGIGIAKVSQFSQFSQFRPTLYSAKIKDLILSSILGHFGPFLVGYDHLKVVPALVALVWYNLKSIWTMIRPFFGPFSSWQLDLRLTPLR
jgi:hypothetical protein